MNKLKVKKIVVSDKIYINKEDVDDFNKFKYAFTYDLGKEFITTLEEYDNDTFSIPSNAWWMLDFDEYIDKRNFPENNKYPFLATLRSDQIDAVKPFVITKSGNIRSGILQAPCGWGKGYVGCYLIAHAKTKVLILLHTKLLMRQWVGELEKLLNIKNVGIIGDSICNIQNVTVGLYKSVNNRMELVKNHFGMVIQDECHLSPADLFSTTLNNINTKIKIGFSATPVRKDGRHIVLNQYFTNFMVKAEDPNKVENINFKIQKTDIPFTIRDIKRDWSRQLTTLGNNENYLELLSNFANNDIRNNRCILILHERVAALRALQKLIPQSALMVGSTSEDDRKRILGSVGNTYMCILSTKLFDEGISCHRLDTLYLTCPSNNPPKLEQRIGRIIREHPEKNNPLIRDFWLKGPIVNRQQIARKAWYINREYKEIE